MNRPGWHLRAARTLFLAGAMMAAAAPAEAQTTRHLDATDARVPPTLARVASPDARFVLTDDGRVRRAWRLGVAIAGEPAPARAQRFLEEHAASLALAPRARVRFDRVVRAHGFTIVRFVRTAFGGDVVGSSIVVRFAADGTLDYVAIDGADAPLSTSARRIAPDRAAQIARTAMGASRVLDVAPAALELDGAIVPVVRVDVAGEHLSQRWRAIVDARDGALLLAHELLSHALGRVFPQNPVSDADTTADVELPFLTSSEHLTGRYFRVEGCNAGDRGCEPMALATADADGNFLYDPEEPSFTDPFAEVQAYYHLNRIAAYFRDTHGFTWTCNGSSVMQAYVNYAEGPGAPYDNAAYVPGAGSDCGYIFFGQGAALDFAYDADVVYHETTHSVVDGVAGLGSFVSDRLGMSYEPGAINEGTADYFAATVQGDPLLAEYFMAQGAVGEGALRRLDNDLACPTDLVGESHYDGRIWAGLAWDVREAIGAEKTDALVFATLGSLGATATLAEAADALVATAAAMQAAGTLDAADVTRIDDAIAARGLIGCERIVPLDDGATHTAYSGDPMLTGWLGGSIAPVHYRIDVPADATSLRLELTRLTLAGRYHVYARTGGPVRFVRSRRPPLLATADWELDRSGQVVIDGRSDPPLPRCDTLYLAIVTEDLTSAGPSLFTIAASLERSGRDERCEADAGAQGDAGLDAGAPPELVYGPSGGGCACRASTVPAHRVASFSTMIALLALVGARRRRR